MAFSSSIKRAQAIKLCELCQEDSSKWRCIECNMCLCEKCRTFHMRVPVTAQHQLVSIGTPLQDIQKKIIIDNIPCKDHPKEKTCLFCRTCDFLICPDFVSSSHKKHNFVPIESALNEKLDNLRSIHEKIDEKLICCESKTSEIKATKPSYNAIFDDSVTKIKQKEQELINAIKKHSKYLQEKVETERSQVNNTLSKIVHEMNNTKKNLTDQRDEIEATLSSNQGSIIFGTIMKIKDLEFDSIPTQVEQFIPETEPAIVQDIFGSLKTLTIPTVHAVPKVDFEVIGTFASDLPDIDQVVILDDKSAWISSSQKQGIWKVEIQGKTMKTSQKVSLAVFRMALTSNNDLLCSKFGQNDVKLLERSGQVKTFLTVYPLLPNGTHATQDGEVIIGAVDGDNLFTPTDQSKRAVIVFGKDKKEKHRYQYDNDGKRLFTNPTRFSTTKNKDITVVDSTSNYSGRIIALNRKGKLRWKYGGHPKINATEQFDPAGIVTTTTGCIIVSDYGSHALHVLSVDGDILTCKVMRDTGIMCPWGLDIDNTGSLWLGCSAPEDKTKTKLKIIKLIQ